MWYNITMTDIERALGRLEGKMDSMIASLNRINGTITTHEGKIDKIERKIAIIQTKAAAFGTGAGAIIILSWEYIKNKWF
ncbi:MAG TPA: hypothetical protein ENI23_12495 [bacterium]|nr:hypothetical protein [bacterium]